MITAEQDRANGSRAATRALWGVALLVSVIPLWVVRDIPMVDMPQHLYVLDVLNRLQHPDTIYSQWFVTSFPPTPYLGYYVGVHLLSQVIPLEFANRVFVTSMVVAWPLSLFFLLGSLGRPRWPALLAAPCAYGDSFGWGFVNTMAGMTLSLLALGAFTRSVLRPSQRVYWGAACALLTLLTLAMHPVPLLFVGLGSLCLLLMLPTPVRPGGNAQDPFAKWSVLAAFLPAAILGFLWLWGLQHGPSGSQILIKSESLMANLQAFPWLLANLFLNDWDFVTLLLPILLFAAACVVRLFESAPSSPGMTRGQRWALPVLAMVALILFLALPLDIQPHIQYLNPRFAPLAGALILASVPRLGPRGTRVFTLISPVVPIVLGVVLSVGFRRFDREAAAWHRLATQLPAKTTVMNLPFDRASGVMHHPVFLHNAAVLARLTGGLPSYCLAGWSQSPIRWRTTGPATYDSEWSPEHFHYPSHAREYGAFLLRGGNPDSVFAGRLGRELSIASHDEDFWLVLRNPSSK